MVETKASSLAATNAAFEEQLKEAVILATLVMHPELIDDFESDLERLETTRPEHETVRRALIGAERRDREEIEATCGADALEKLFAPRHVRICPGVQPGVHKDMAAMSVAEELAKLAARRGARSEIEDAARDIEGLADEGLTWRLRQVAEGLTSAGKAARDVKTEYDTGPNGARLSRDEKRDFEALIERIDYSKGGRKDRR